MNFLVHNHDICDDRKAALCCCYSNNDDKNYISREILKRLKIREGADGNVFLSFVNGGRISNREFIVQDCTSRGEQLMSDIMFGMKTPAESVEEGSPVEEI